MLSYYFLITILRGLGFIVSIHLLMTGRIDHLFTIDSTHRRSGPLLTLLSIHHSLLAWIVG